MLYSSTLALLVTRIRAYDPQDTVPADDLAVAANLSDRSSDFHGSILFKS